MDRNTQKRCINKTKDGKRCSKYPLKGKEYCSFHLPIETYNIECPICLESTETESKFFILKCNHRLHFSCCSGLINDECPICRVKMNLPTEVIEKISENSKKYAEETEQEQHEALREQFHNITRFHSRRDIITCRAEVLGVLRFLRDSGFPMRYWRPNSITITIPQTPGPDIQGFLALMLLNMIMERMEADIAENEDDSEDDSEDEDSEDEFREENEELAILSTLISIERGS